MLRTVSPREYSVEEVLDHVTATETERTYDGYRVRMNSLRYHVFLRGRTCPVCKAEGTVFLLQRNDGDTNQPPDRAHFNLYARVGDDLVLMTKDHVVPRSRGGKDRLDNLVAMCVTCNSAKGSAPA